MAEEPVPVREGSSPVPEDTVPVRERSSVDQEDVGNVERDRVPSDGPESEWLELANECVAALESDHEETAEFVGRLLLS